MSEVTEFKVVNCSCINDIPTIRGGLHEIVGLVILGLPFGSSRRIPALR